MFKFLKDKIKQTVEKFSSTVEEEAVEVKIEDLNVEEKEIIEQEEKKGFFKKMFSKKEPVEEVTDEDFQEEKVPEIKKVEEEPKLEEKLITEEVIDKEEEVIPEIKQEIIEPIPEEVVDEVEEVIPEIKQEIAEEKQEAVVNELKSETAKQDTDSQKPVILDATKKKKGFFSKIKEKIVRFKLDDEKFEELFWEFELGLMESNVAISVIEKIKEELKEKLTSENVSKKGIDVVIAETLRNAFEDILSVPSFDLIEKIKSGKKPFIISMIGVNGSGKTTTLAKIINLLQKNNLSVVVAASDTFRAAAIDQIEEHTTKLGVKLIKHDYNADPAAVAFDAIKHAEAKKIDVVLIDTAGRLHSNTNLMDELKKVIRIAKPDLKIFVGESITGNDCVEQATEFNSLVGIDAMILSKADVDDNGGAAISVSYVTKKPILYLGTGQGYDDLIKFDKNLILEQLGF